MIIEKKLVYRYEVSKAVPRPFTKFGKFRKTREKTWFVCAENMLLLWAQIQRRG